MYPVIILCGGRGTRLGSITDTIPKPMVRIGDEPLVIHIIKRFLKFGFSDFILATGYKHEEIEKQFYDFRRGYWIPIRQSYWQHAFVECIYTGDNTQTGERLRQAWQARDADKVIMTYGDGLADIDIFSLTKFHSLNDGLVTLTAVHPSGRFGALKLDQTRVISFKEKGEQLRDTWVNGGFMVIDKAALDYIHGDEMWEHDPCERLAKDGKLFAFKHEGFFWGMDTSRDLEYLNELWTEGNAPWMK